MTLASLDPSRPGPSRRGAARRAPQDRAGSEAREQGTLLGLYHGYDMARLELAKLVQRCGRAPLDPRESDAAGRARLRREGYSEALFEHSETPSREGWSEGAHSAVLTAFSTVSEQAESLLTQLCERWPELREELGGPLPSAHLSWQRPPESPEFGEG